MNIVIADDDFFYGKKLERDVKKFFSTIDRKINIFILTENFYSILNYDSIDIIFLDVDLKAEKNGITLGKQIKKIFPNIILVFTSSNNDFVFPALSIGFFQFIRKNEYNYDIEKVFMQIKNYYIEHNKDLLITVNKKRVILKLNEIIYVLAIGHELTIKTISNEYNLSMSLKKFKDSIDFRYLIQIQRNLIINLSFVNDLTRTELIMDDNKKYKIGRKYQESVLKKYERFLLQWWYLD